VVRAGRIPQRMWRRRMGCRGLELPSAFLLAAALGSGARLPFSVDHRERYSP
jgi:hypothetical protein